MAATGAVADENVTQREHALQSALLAEQAAGKENHEIVTSSLLHDIGHLLLDEHAGDDSFLAEDLEHEVVGQAWLERYFSPAVTLPVLYHVAAKRYLTSVPTPVSTEPHVASVSLSLCLSVGVCVCVFRLHTFMLPGAGGSGVLRWAVDLIETQPGGARRPLYSDRGGGVH